MRKESRILIYIPKEFHDRYNDLAGLEYKIRKLENYQTRIKWGYDDLELHKKVRGSDRWEQVALPEELPKVNMNPRSSKSLSPAPGRPQESQSLGRGEKRDRGSPGTSPDQVKQKSRRPDEEVDKHEDIRSKRSDIWKDIIERAELVGEATISPTKENQGLKTQLDRGPKPKNKSISFCYYPPINILQCYYSHNLQPKRSTIFAIHLHHNQAPVILTN